MSYLRQQVRFIPSNAYHHTRSLPERDLLTRLRRDQSAAVAGRIAEIAPPRAGHTVHAVAEARRPAFGRQFFHRRGRHTARLHWNWRNARYRVHGFAGSAAGGGEARLGRKAAERRCT